LLEILHTFLVVDLISVKLKKKEPREDERIIK
jgi:hypothetical protein